MDKSTNSLNWFEIPVTDMDRARRFYEAVFDIEMHDMNLPGFRMVTFPWENGTGKANGALVKHEMYRPSADGVVIYLNANPDIQAVIGRIESAGGSILIPKTQISPEIGYMAFFTDTEGNRLALHAEA